MSETNKNEFQPKMNSLIPMEDPEGQRCFVNSWDVADRKADGWKVVGDERRHLNRTDAPIEELIGGEPAKAGKPAGKGGKKGPAAGGDPADPETPPA
jgi:hypothetical protein